MVWRQPAGLVLPLKITPMGGCTSEDLTPCGICLPWGVLIGECWRGTPTRQCKSCESGLNRNRDWSSVFDKTGVLCAGRLFGGILPSVFFCSLLTSVWSFICTSSSRHSFLPLPLFNSKNMVLLSGITNLRGAAKWVASRERLFIILCCHSSFATESLLWLFPWH